MEPANRTVLLWPSGPFELPLWPLWLLRLRVSFWVIDMPNGRLPGHLCSCSHGYGREKSRGAITMAGNVWPNFVVEGLLLLAFVAALILRYPHHE